MILLYFNYSNNGAKNKVSLLEPSFLGLDANHVVICLLQLGVLGTL